MREYKDGKIVKFVANQQPKNEKNDIASEEVPLLSGYDLQRINKRIKSFLKKCESEKCKTLSIQKQKNQ